MGLGEDMVDESGENIAAALTAVDLVYRKRFSNLEGVGFRCLGVQGLGLRGLRFRGLGVSG